ncbi:MAG TPA: SDR family NAD(P)-dependent oxidoreductase [Candidatus Acidoferrales bacterium]|nr:SDR family NAD(P)-dependent oxidoreductase [Candidatus Acidoferrales bacterium]
MRLEGKVAVVTGCARERGIGRAIAMRLAREGANVVAADYCRSIAEYPDAKFGQMEELEGLAAEIRKIGRRSIAVKVDVTDEAEVAAMAEAAMKEFGRVDILCNNAGGGVGGGPVVQQTLDSWNRTVAINLTGTFLCAKHVAPKIIAGGRGGRIINTASIAGKRGGPMMAAYSSAKHGVIGLTRSLALELGAFNITVNAVCPGFVETQLFEGLINMVGTTRHMNREQVLKTFVQQVPMGRMENGDDVANVVAFLASEDGGYMTGQALNICGGVETH